MEVTLDASTSLEELEDFLVRKKSKSERIWEETKSLLPMNANPVNVSGQGGVRVDWGGKNGPVVSVGGSGQVNVGNGHVSADVSHNTKTGEGHVAISGGGTTNQTGPRAK